MRDVDRYLFKRGKRWAYVRRVPEHVAHLDDRGRIQVSLKTNSIETARIRRDRLEDADNFYWASLLSDGKATDMAAKKRYDAAKSRAMALGFAYRTADALALDEPIETLVKRIETLERRGVESVPDSEALLGGASVPSIKISDALETYMAEIAPVELKGKSAKQAADWKKIKQRAVKNFISVVGDLTLDQIDRAEAVKFHDWWRDRVTGATTQKPMSGNSANRELGNLRVLYREYFKRLGQEDRPNPFRGLNFKDPKPARNKVEPFDTDWIRDVILAPGALSSLNDDARLVVLAMIETGCRPSELCNLVPENIRLDHDVPHLHIVPTDERAIKTDSSIRDIPLVGVSLSALQAAPQGFPRYRDKEDTLSATLMKHFRKNGLFQNNSQRIYSFRHSFEKRMMEAGIDYGLRCLLMGHATNRPEYGDGGSLEYRRDEMLKFALE